MTFQRDISPGLSPWLFHVLAALVLACLGGRASAQLREDQVLVVYDSRIADSLAVAEYYAGSPKVPGGAGALHGIHPAVRVLDLATTSQPVMGVPDIDYATFVSSLRDPIRSHLTATDPTDLVRCIVLTKGIPHRVQDQTNPTIGDLTTPAPAPYPNAEQWFFAEFNAGNITYASVDSELVLLWQNLNDGAGGQTQGSRAAGMIVNPYARSSQPISLIARTGLHTQKTLQPLYTPPTGIVWRSSPTGAALTAGDLYLVCRLDAPTVPDVISIIDRAQTRYVDMNAGGIVLDESRSNGIADTTPVGSGEIDNQDFGDTLGDCYLWGGDDYEQSRDLLASDGRWNPARVHYDALGGINNYILGTRSNFTEGLFVTDTLVFLASEANNHQGPLPGNGSAGQYLPRTFFYAPMSAYNTAESYSGRAFGGLGNRFNQSSISEAIQYGITFAVGDVWEPLAPSMPDNYQLLRNFYLGQLSWAEAAYTSIPTISWQGIVIGDPLARVQRSSEDIDADGRVSIDDAYRWEVLRTDINRSGAGNNADRQIIEKSLRAAEFIDLRGSQRP